MSKNNLPNFDRDSFPTHNSTPAPQVEFEIRHTREHLEKLKFIYLELYTKRGFLSHLTDSEEWRACQTTRWTPGELKQLERELEPSKTTLKAEKTKSAELQRILAEKCEAALCLQKDVQDKHEETSELMRRYREAEDTLRDLRETMPSAPTRSMEELQSILDEQSITLEKKTIALERQRSAVQDLERLLAIHEAENAKLMVIQTDLDARRTALTKEQSREDESLSKLCRWYASAAETLSQLTGCRVEMVQPDYLLANVSNVPVHIHVDSVTGKLRDVKVGSTSSTPKRQWKELVDAAIEFNDIPFLIRAIHAAANK